MSSTRTLSAERPLAGLRLAFVTRHHPYIGNSGSTTYIAALLRGLADVGASIRVIVIEPPAEISSRVWQDTYPYGPGIETRIRYREARGHTHVLPRKYGWSPLKSTIRRLLGRRPPPAAVTAWPAWDRPVSADESAYVHSQVDDFRPHAVMANYSWIAGIWRETEPSGAKPLRLILTHDVRHLECRLENGRTTFQEKRGYPRARELEELALGDVLIAIQKREELFFKNAFPAKTVITAGLPAIASAASRAPVAGRCLLVGSNNEANATGARWFLDQVWPLVTRDVPAASLYLCGGVCSHALLADLPGGVVRRGRVDDLGSEYRAASVVVAPLLQGSGLKIKVVEALGYGCALVGTSVALDGIEIPAELAASDTPETFARRVTELLVDAKTRRTAEDMVNRFARSSSSTASCFGPLIDQLAKICSDKTAVSRTILVEP